MSVNVNDADWQKIQELFAKERQWMTDQMQKHIREVNEMFYDERKRVRERYKEYNETYLGHYVQYFFWFFCVIGIVIFRLDYLPATRQSLPLDEVIYYSQHGLWDSFWEQRAH